MGAILVQGGGHWQGNGVDEGEEVIHKENHEQDGRD
jgi:hypothetical protein